MSSISLFFTLFVLVALWKQGKATARSNTKKIAIPTGDKLVHLAIPNTNVPSVEYRAENVYVNGDKLKPQSLKIKYDGSTTVAYDKNNGLLFVTGDKHDIIKTGDEYIDIADNKKYGYSSSAGDIISTNVTNEVRINNIMRQSTTCGPSDTERYLNVYITADSSFCKVFNGPTQAEQRALFYMAAGNTAFSRISCLRIKLSTFSINCNEKDDIYTTAMNGLQNNDILYKFRNLKQSTSTDGISIFLQGKDDGTHILGAAFQGTACNSNLAFGWVDGINAGSQTLTHEIGHLVNMPHVAEGIMTPYFNHHTAIEFSQESIDSVLDFMDGDLSTCITTKKTKIERNRPTQCKGVTTQNMLVGCTKKKKLGALPVIKEGLPKNNAKLLTRQLCESKLLVRLNFKKLKYYKLKLMTIKYSFDGLNEMSASQSAVKAKSVDLTLNLNDLSLPKNGESCCGSQAKLKLLVRYEYFYKVKEDGKDRKLWKWSSGTADMQGHFQYKVHCEQSNTCRGSC